MGFWQVALAVKTLKTTIHKRYQQFVPLFKKNNLNDQNNKIIINVTPYYGTLTELIATLIFQTINKLKNISVFQCLNLC